MTAEAAGRRKIFTTLSVKRGSVVMIMASMHFDGRRIATVDRVDGEDVYLIFHGHAKGGCVHRYLSEIEFISVLCDCSQAELCPQGRSGSSLRCTIWKKREVNNER